MCDMRINSETVLEGERILLVPYRKEHVPRLVKLCKTAKASYICVSVMIRRCTMVEIDSNTCLNDI